MKNFFSSLFNFFSTPWWVKIATAEPNCVYYFGPFSSEREAIQHQPGFVEDLQQESAQGLEVSILNCATPTQLTIEFEPSKQPVSV